MRKYKLEIAACTNAEEAIKILVECAYMSVEVANTCIERGELEADPDDPKYRELIDRLDAIRVEVYDYEKVQLPKIEGIDREPKSYTLSRHYRLSTTNKK